MPACKKAGFLRLGSVGGQSPVSLLSAGVNKYASPKGATVVL